MLEKSAPAKSQSQQRLMGMVHAIHKGENVDSAKAHAVAKTMKPGDAEDFASTKHKGLPVKKDAKEKKAALVKFANLVANHALLKKVGALQKSAKAKG